MIIEAGFTKEMKETLRSLKGRVFKSFECGRLDDTKTIVGGFRINLGRFSVDVSFDYHPLDGQPGGFDEPTWFSCGNTVPDSPLDRYLAEEGRQYLVDEVITGVELVQDQARYTADDITFVMDMALVLRTKYHTYAFSRGTWFDFVLDVEVAEAESGPSRLDAPEKLWHEEDQEVVVQRSVITL